MEKYLANEKSFLNSPCFNIKNLERPVISMDLIMQTDKNKDGGVLRIIIDGLTWSPVGSNKYRINWFNTVGFGLGNIGSSQWGWSGNSFDLEDNTDVDTLVTVNQSIRQHC